MGSYWNDKLAQGVKQCKFLYGILFLDKSAQPLLRDIKSTFLLTKALLARIEFCMVVNLARNILSGQ